MASYVGDRLFNIQVTGIKFLGEGKDYNCVEDAQ